MRWDEMDKWQQKEVRGLAARYRGARASVSQVAKNYDAYADYAAGRINADEFTATTGYVFVPGEPLAPVAEAEPQPADETPMAVVINLPVPTRRPTLTTAQTDAVTLIAAGLTRREAADHAGITVAAMSSRIQRAYRALGVHSKTDAARAITTTTALAA